MMERPLRDFCAPMAVSACPPVPENWWEPRLSEQHVTGDVGSVLAGQEQSGLGDLLGLTEAAQHGLLSEAIQHLLRHGLDNVGHGVAGGDAVDADGNALACKLLGPCLGQADDAGLSSGVVCLADVAELTNNEQIDKMVDETVMTILEKGLFKPSALPE